MSTKSPHLDRDWLHQKYVVEGLSTYDIGKLVSRNPKRIYEKLMDFQIPTRPRGENLKGADNYMKGVVEGKYVNPFLGKKHTPENLALLSKLHSKPNPKLRGTGNGMYGRTGASNPNYKGGVSPDRQAVYSSQEWKEVSAKVLARDNYTCCRCALPTSYKRPAHLHHIKSWTIYPEGRLDPSNMVLLCRPCHHWVHSKENRGRDFIEDPLAQAED